MSGKARSGKQEPQPTNTQERRKKGRRNLRKTKRNTEKIHEKRKEKRKKQTQSRIKRLRGRIELLLVPKPLGLKPSPGTSQTHGGSVTCMWMSLLEALSAARIMI